MILNKVRYKGFINNIGKALKKTYRLVGHLIQKTNIIK